MLDRLELRLYCLVPVRGAAMRIVTYGGAVSLDGFLAGENGSMDWLNFSKDAREIMAGYWKDVDTILMGRISPRSPRLPKPARSSVSAPRVPGSPRMLCGPARGW